MSNQKLENLEAGITLLTLSPTPPQSPCQENTLLPLSSHTLQELQSSEVSDAELSESESGSESLSTDENTYSVQYYIPPALKCYLQAGQHREWLTSYSRGQPEPIDNWTLQADVDMFDDADVEFATFPEDNEPSKPDPAVKLEYARVGAMIRAWQERQQTKPTPVS